MTTEQAPLQGLTSVLQDYFDRHSIVAVNDPWSRIADGFIVRVHVYRWIGRVTLEADDFGLQGDDYRALQKAIKWGSINLLPDDIGATFESLTTQARALPRKWGREVHWGLFVPVQALPKFKEDWAALQTRWNENIDRWIADYPKFRQEAQQRVAAFAGQSWSVAHKLEHIRTIQQYRERESFVAAMTSRIMEDYPTPEAIRERFRLDYEAAFIPTPALEAEQAAHLEQINLEQQQRLAQMRHELEQQDYQNELERLQKLSQIDAEQLKQQEKLKIVQEFAEETRQKLKQQQKRLLQDFYQGYALDIRQRLHEGLALLMEGVASGKLNPQATRSLRVALSEIKHLALDDDIEIQEMRAKLDDLMNQPRLKAEEIREQIQDFGTLLQTSILAMGQTPRAPRRKSGDPPPDLLAGLDAEDLTISQVRQRAGLSASLAEDLTANLDPGTLRRRAGQGADIAVFV